MKPHTKIKPENNTSDKHSKIRAGEKGKDKPNFTPNPNKKTKNAIISIFNS